MRSLMVLALCLILINLSGCISTYSVRYEDVGENGSYTTVKITEMVGAGGKVLSKGTADAGVESDGAWSLKLGHDSDSDMTMSVSLLEAIFNAGVKSGVAAAVGVPQ